MSTANLPGNIDLLNRPSRAHGAWPVTILTWSAICYAAYAWTTLERSGLTERPAALALGTVVLVALWIVGLVTPLATTLLLLFAIPLFGNQPSGPYMEVINLPLAASTAGLALAARRRHVADGPAAAAWAAYVMSALLALVPALPAIWIRAAMINHWPATIVTALTAPADDPLYTVASFAGVSLSVAFAAALTMFAPPPAFWTRAARVLVYGFVAVMAVGVLHYHGLIDLDRSYLLRIDPQAFASSGFQSIFWNSGWFAWYVVLIAGLAVGHLLSAPMVERRLLVPLLLACYLYFFANPQRGGFIALHAGLALAAYLFFVSRGGGARARLPIIVGAGAALVGGAVLASALGYVPRSIGASLYRLVAQPGSTAASDSVRVHLWTVAVRMWRDAPVFGLGEGSFAWRFEDYAPVGSPLFYVSHGDAHNTWLQMAATRGALGLICFIAVLWTAVRTLRAQWRRPGADRGRIIGLSMSLLGFFIYTFVQGMFYLQALQVLFWFVLAWTMAGEQGSATAVRPSARWGRLAAIAAIAALVLQVALAGPQIQAASATLTRQPRGFFPREGRGAEVPWRWSGAEGTLCVQPEGPIARMRLATGDPRREAYPRTVTLAINGEVIRRLVVTSPDAIVVDVPVPYAGAPVPASQIFGECSGQPGEVRLTVAVDRTWRPMGAGLGTDPRRLGVQVFAPTYRTSQ